MIQRLIISGATGAIGTYLIKRLIDAAPLAQEIICLFRRRESIGRCARSFGGSLPHPIRPVLCDLSCQDSVRVAIAELPPSQFVLGVHLAADVSWDRTLAELSEVNVNGTLRFAEIVSRTSTQGSLVYVSSAYASQRHGFYRNGYEESKVVAERALRAAYRQLDTTTFSCSLVAGHSETGEISSFHGVYPLFRFIEAFRPPFVVGDADKLIDTVPLDWTVNQLLELIKLKSQCRGPEDVVASAGDQRICFAEFIKLICTTLATHQNAEYFRSDLPIVSPRRWEFLMRTMKTWQVKDQCVRKFSTFAKLVAIYSPYVTEDQVLAPLNVTVPAPDPRVFIPRCIDYCFTSRAHCACAAR